MNVDVRAYGRRELLVQPEQVANLLPFAAAASALPGVEEVVPAARTVLVVCVDSAAAERVAASLPAVQSAPADASTGATDEVVVDVTYDGADVQAVADEVGMSAAELVRRHADGHYVVAFCGFTPGFAYLSGLDPQLHVSRLADPRTRVPAGAVGIAGEFTGVYPRSSPGGWRLLGQTDARLWDVDRDPPALLSPGTRVRFRAT
jgi:KipI family sensor histidine kinase inhibitor